MPCLCSATPDYENDEGYFHGKVRINKNNLFHNRRRSPIMQEIVLFIVIIGVYLLMQLYILPKMGIST
ncbi:conserved hypothetical protein [Desulfamplus magnetovallimortis]|uniref:Uncharacterized protein n=1 Tax=Desulfamplus magnetovallimortis TaxID=1246637 RepID=A0A1W1HIG1_9BACT|nr:conserved hypothetical protein [Desulfamplus magnetovallimortis]